MPATFEPLTILQQKSGRQRRDKPAGRNNLLPVGATEEDPASCLSLLESAVAEIELLSGKLATTQSQAASARAKADPLVQTAAHLRAKLLGLSKLVAGVRQSAFHDELTRLPTRALLRDRLRQAMILALRQKKQVALLMIDLDGFKQVNDAYGHDTGDNLLQHVAWLLRTCVRGSDTVCRYGGDEFVIMLPEIEGMGCAQAVVEKIRARLSASFFIADGLIPVTASIGVALFPEDGTDCDSLLKRADVLMYREKIRASTLDTVSPTESTT